MAMGGVGEAMLLGAAMGGGSAALTGGDPLKGALMGGLTGGIGGAISPALSAMTGGAPAAGAISAAPAAAAAPAAGAVPTGAGIDSLLGAGDSLQSITQNIANNPGLYPPGSTLPGNATMFTGTSTPGVTTTVPSAAPAENFAYNPVTRTNDIIPNTVTSAPTPNAYTIPSAYGSNVIPPASAAAPAAPAAAPVRATGGTFAEGMQRFMKDPIGAIKADPLTAASAAFRGATGARKELEEPDEYDGPLKRFKFNPSSYQPSFFAAEGGIANLAAGGYDRMVGEDPMYMSNMASGGISDLGSYSDYAQGGRMLKGPGDGMSDSIPASIANKRPARLATEEFVVPADVVSGLGNGSSDAGAKQLYAMMDRVRKARTGRKSQGREIDPRQYMAA